MTNHPAGSWNTRRTPGARPLRVPRAESANTAQVPDAGAAPGAPGAITQARGGRGHGERLPGRAWGWGGKPDGAPGPAWEVLATARGSGSSSAGPSASATPNAANWAALCPRDWVQLPSRRDTRSLSTAEINTAYTNIYPYGFAAHLPKLEYFLMTQLNATITRFNTLLPLWPQVQYQR